MLGLLALSGTAYLAFIFPKTMALWADQGRALSFAERSLANLSGLCQSYGLLLIPALLLVVVGGGVWAVFASMGSRQEAANK